MFWGPHATLRVSAGLEADELPPEIVALEGFSEILSTYYQEQKIGQLWRQVQPIYSREVELRLHDPVSQIVLSVAGYLRESSNRRAADICDRRRAGGGRITNVRNFGDHYALC